MKLSEQKKKKIQIGSIVEFRHTYYDWSNGLFPAIRSKRKEIIQGLVLNIIDNGFNPSIFIIQPFNKERERMMLFNNDNIKVLSNG